MPALAKDVEGLGDDRSLDAPARHRARHLGVLADRHRRARVAGTGALDVDDAGDRHPLAGGAPALHVVQDLLHREITSASSSRATTEWPSTKSSTYGRAAAIPRASGAYPGVTFRGLTHTTLWSTRWRRAICSA